MAAPLRSRRDRSEADSTPCETASLRFLSRLQEGRFGRTSLQRRRRPPAAGSGQPPGQRMQCSRDSRDTHAPTLATANDGERATARATDESETDTPHGDHHATPYTFTEKKRIRKSFAKRASVLPVPFLLETQLASYRAFLQEGTPMASAQERRPAGRVHVDLPDLEPLGQRPPRVRRLFAAARRRSTSSSASSAA